MKNNLNYNFFKKTKNIKNFWFLFYSYPYPPILYQYIINVAIIITFSILGPCKSISKNKEYIKKI